LIKKIYFPSAVFFFQFLVIKTLDPNPDSLEMLDPDLYPDTQRAGNNMAVTLCTLFKLTIKIFAAEWILCPSCQLYGTYGIE
jgi:hypothetical protein